MQQNPTTPDEDLREEILALLAVDNRSPIVGLRVGVLNSIVHLAGTVDSLQDRARAEELAGRVPGVRGVANRIEAPGAPSPAREINLEINKSNERREKI